MTEKSENLSIRLQPKVRTEVDRLAKLTRRSRNFIINEAVTHYVTEQAKFVESVKIAFEEADKGVFVSEKSMTEWFLALDTEHEMQFPSTDVIVRQE